MGRARGGRRPFAPVIRCYLLAVLIHLLAELRVGGVQVEGGDFYASLTRIGHVRGQVRALPAGRVVAFLGLPYAAPPTGLLRFMPPGALSQQALRPGGQFPLMPSGQRALVRDHSHFGPKCVRLADWLSAGPASKREAAGALGGPMGAQSEDCLNLNVFVPIHGSAANVDSDQIRANRPSQQQQKQQQQLTWRQAGAKSAAGSPNASDQAESQRPLWPIVQAAESGLPVLVLVHGGGAQSGRATANSAHYLRLLRAANLLLVTFNYRIGLLGFVPFAEGATGSRENKLPSRNNHAIWDQIGLLHWIKRNIAAFNGDPNQVTMLALDNQAAQLVQVLALSPIAKDLFNRMILMHDESQVGEHDFTFSQLLGFAHKARDSRRRLSSNLLQIVQSLVGPNSSTRAEPTNDEATFVSRFLQTANLHLLAKVELEIKRLGSDRLLAMVARPSLDDNLLLPNLLLQLRDRLHQTGADVGDQTGDIATLARVQLRQELNYCSYTRRLYANKSDPLGLLVKVKVGTNLAQTKDEQVTTKGDRFALNWYRELNQTSARSKLRRSLISVQFNHLHNLHLLQQLLAPTSSRNIGANSSEAKEEATNSEPAGDELKREFGRLRWTSRTSTGADQGRPNESRGGQVQQWEQADSELEQALGPLAAFDLLLGHVAADQTARQPDPSALQTRTTNLTRQTAQMASALAGLNSLDSRTVDLFKFADLHFAASMLANSSVARYCDFLAPNSVPHSSSSFAFSVQKSALSAHSFATRGPDLQSSEIGDRGDWLIDLIEDDSQPILLEGLVNFVRFGDPNQSPHDHPSEETRWPLYDPLDRNIKMFPPQPKLNSTGVSTLSGQLKARLNLLPYLQSLNWSNTDRDTQIALADPSDLLACLAELDLKAGTDSHQNIQLNSHCLSNSISKLRSLLRQYAMDDLSPLLRFNRQRLTDSHNSSLLQSSSLSPLATRNLVEDSLAGSGSESNGSQQNDESASNRSVLGTYVFPRDSSPSALDGQAAEVGSSRARSGSFLSGAFKDASNQALSLVVGSGLLIFLLNLVIVVLIALRSGKAKRQQAKRRASGASLEATAAKDGPSLAGEQLERVKLTSSLRGERASGELRATKQLKFDLGCVDQVETASFHDAYNSTEIGPPASNNLQSAGENLDQSQQQIVLIDPHTSNLTLGSAHNDELVLTASPLKQDKYGYGLQGGESFVLDGRDNLHPQLETGPPNWPEALHYCGRDLAQNCRHQCKAAVVFEPNGNSPFASQSCSTGTVTTTTSTTNGVYGKINAKRPSKHSLACNQAALCQPINHSAASPGSSTTLSMTPVQLQEQFSNVSASSMQSPHFRHMNPVGLVYETENLGAILEPHNFIEQSDNGEGGKLVMLLQQTKQAHHPGARY